jgi:hypothetical protein
MDCSIMSSLVLYASGIVVFVHGLIHLMGLVAYWQIAEIQELPYKTTLLDGRWNLGEAGIRFFGMLWPVAAIGFAVAAYGLVTQQDWWRAVMLSTTLLSLVITLLDWKVAFLGAVFNVVIVAVVFLAPGLFVLAASQGNG